ncbi:D-beta-hydroxybutyrate dehydrogenase, mitochondrial-like [Haliotis rufescens]|uniref:D-beta-hydroxybutyrate dehydrogenase, mitochondrial-like n=1 Tax=Haliotis rufescens TaxID=6454 RepID=UPI00201F3525|nr:D-beta-hydroxybutyrate dehydrogenase, mitochondrial-like [Haliotis rufescens]
MDLLQTLGPQAFEVTFFLSFLLLLYSAINLHMLMSMVLFSLLYYTYQVIRKRTVKYTSPTDKYVLITGCDTGIGHSLAITLDDIGFNVIATCLHAEGEGAKQLRKAGSKRMHVLEVDVSSDDSVAKCLKYVENECQTMGLWALVNNAGINFLGDIELATMKQYIYINNVNNFGPLRMTKAFLPLIRKARGRVVNVTSVKGRFALPSNAAYSMTKWAGENFSDTLRLEMKKFGVKVIIMEPGHFGGATGCLNKEGVARIRKDLDEQWEESSEDVRYTYGKEYLDEQFQAAISSSSTSFPTLHPIMAAFKDALLNEQPQNRYLTDGSNGLYDPYCLCARLYCVLPETWMDKIVDYHFGRGPVVNALK